MCFLSFKTKKPDSNESGFWWWCLQYHFLL